MGKNSQNVGMLVAIEKDKMAEKAMQEKIIKKALKRAFKIKR